MTVLERFDWPQTREVVSRWSEQVRLAVDPRGRALVGDGDGAQIRVEVPLLQPVPEGIADASEYLAELSPRLGVFLILLMQAGAVAVGRWRDDVLERHKSIRKYVVRGRGKAQPAYLKTKGKSRYGSRLRLAQARELLDETGALLGDWAREVGGFRAVYYSCPPRLWADLFACRTPPPFDPRAPAVAKIPRDVDRPSHDELLATHRFLSRGRVLEGPLDAG